MYIHDVLYTVDADMFIGIYLRSVICHLKRFVRIKFIKNNHIGHYFILNLILINVDNRETKIYSSSNNSGFKVLNLYTIRLKFIILKSIV